MDTIAIGARYMGQEPNVVLCGRAGSRLIESDGWTSEVIDRRLDDCL